MVTRANVQPTPIFVAKRVESHAKEFCRNSQHMSAPSQVAPIAGIELKKCRLTLTVWLPIRGLPGCFGSIAERGSLTRSVT
jgi:hypothetical protein